MTEVTFHFNVADPVEYAGRLVRKAAGSGVKVVVTGDAGALERLDAELWTATPTDFFPHCHAATAQPHVLRASPVVLAASARGTPHHQVLVNVGGGLPDGFEKFERLNEVVSQEDADREQAR
ncbi:MAG TPA: DNA polymerase III subunit chi, partial [Ramlibacter sp.]